MGATLRDFSSLQIIVACIILHNYCVRRRLSCSVLPHLVVGNEDSNFIQGADDNSETDRGLLQKRKETGTKL